MQLELGPLVDVAIVICGLFIAMGTVCSFVTEQIAVFLELRGEKLFTAVQNLVFSADLATKIFAHPIIDVTVNDKRGPGQRPADKPNRPSYIDPTKFAAAFWDELADASTMSASDRAAAAAHDAATAQSAQRTEAAGTLVAMRAATKPAEGTGVLPPDAHFEDLRQVVNALPADDPLKKNVLILLATAKNDYDSLLSVTASWFNHQMDRVSGWYKRQTQYIIMILAALLVSISGLDTLEIARGLYASPALVMAAQGAANTFGSGPNADTAAGEQAALTLLRGDTFAPYFHPFFGLLPSPDDNRRNKIAYDNAVLADGLAVAQRDTDIEALALAREDGDKALGQANAAAAKYQNTKSAADRSILQQAIVAAQSAEKAITGDEKAAQADIEAERESANALGAAGLRLDTTGSIRAHWFGWLITFVAAALGAPFWFQVLSTFMNVRGSGPKPQTTNVTPGITPSATT